MPNKPVARRWSGGGWICISHDFWRGYGPTPMDAYCALMSFTEAARALKFP